MHRLPQAERLFLRRHPVQAQVDLLNGQPFFL
jgi:hypothetical protein